MCADMKSLKDFQKLGLARVKVTCDSYVADGTFGKVEGGIITGPGTADLNHGKAVSFQNICQPPLMRIILTCTTRSLSKALLYQVWPRLSKSKLSVGDFA